MKGPWTPAGKLPESFGKLPADENWKEVKAALPGKKLTRGQGAAGVREHDSRGDDPADRAARLPDGGRHEARSGSATRESDVFRMGEKGTVYYLVAGRWFSAPGFTGPWTFATPNMPADFQKIPLEHPRSRVLASVPGTQQAAEGVLLAQVPQTARVNKKTLKAPEVTYQGDPKFEPIEKTQVQRAVNTDKDVFKVGDVYYMCYQGVWFMGSSPTGPWEVACQVPRRSTRSPSARPPTTSPT